MTRPTIKAGDTVNVLPPQAKGSPPDHLAGPMIVVEIDGPDYLLRRPGPEGDPAGEVWIHEQRIAAIC
jgi:hypothetical protein